MKIGIIGTGNMGKTLGKLWSAKGHDVWIGSRSAERGQAVASEIGQGVQGGDLVSAAQFGDVILLAVPWFAFTDVERALGETVDGKVVLDCVNPMRSTGSLAVGHKWSAGEEIAKVWHRAKVVKLFNHIHFAHLSDPIFDGKPATAFYCSNSDDAKQVAQTLASDLGFAPVDAGPIKNARLLEPLAVLWIQMAFVMEHRTDFAFRMVDR